MQGNEYIAIVDSTSPAKTNRRNLFCVDGVAELRATTPRAATLLSTSPHNMKPTDDPTENSNATPKTVPTPMFPFETTITAVSAKHNVLKAAQNTQTLKATEDQALNTTTTKQQQQQLPVTVPRKRRRLSSSSDGSAPTSLKRRQSAPKGRKNPSCSSQYRGVCWLNDRKSWRSRIEIQGKREHLGYFDTEEKAAIAYDKRAIKHYGTQTQHLNFPERFKELSDEQGNNNSNDDDKQQRVHAQQHQPARSMPCPVVLTPPPVMSVNACPPINPINPCMTHTPVQQAIFASGNHPMYHPTDYVTPFLSHHLPQASVSGGRVECEIEAGAQAAGIRTTTALGITSSGLSSQQTPSIATATMPQAWISTTNKAFAQQQPIVYHATQSFSHQPTMYMIHPSSGSPGAQSHVTLPPTISTNHHQHHPQSQTAHTQSVAYQQQPSHVHMYSSILPHAAQGPHHQQQMMVSPPYVQFFGMPPQSTAAHPQQLANKNPAAGSETNGEL